MYTVRPKGINIKDNERNVPDGFLQESINLQWKDGSYMPIPERLSTDIPINPSTSNIIMHKVSDEDQINVLTIGTSGVLQWYGKIVDGVYSSSPVVITGFPTITDIDSLSFTILNGLVYFMSVTQEFYYRLQYNETDEAYEVKDMYAWKSLIPYFPQSGIYSGVLPQGTDTNVLLSQCGVILIRFTLVLNTGEEVLHTPIYAYDLLALNTGTSAIANDVDLTNIHTIINTDLDFADVSLLEEEVSAINIYASIAYYVTKTGGGATPIPNYRAPFGSENSKGQIQKLAEEPFYLVKTIEKPGSSSTDKNILFFVDGFDAEIEYAANDLSKIDISTIAAGSVMPVDNFSYHKIFGEITSNNGRLIISNPKTVLSNGHIRALSLNKTASSVGYFINTEDGDLQGVGYSLDTRLSEVLGNTEGRGILSYPDSRASYVGGNIISTSPAPVPLYKTRANKAHNLSCAFNFEGVGTSTRTVGTSGTDFVWTIGTSMTLIYGVEDISEIGAAGIDPLFYTSENRLQFSEIGEFSVWPAINSYRVGEGKIVFTGSNAVDPANADYIAPLFVGTSDGIYTVNFDPTGVNLIQSITRAARLPAISDKNIVIDQNLVYVSDKGLEVISNAKSKNITKDYFPEQGNGGFPAANDVYPDYNLLTWFSGSGANPYLLTDIVDYMKGALFAYDGRRNNVWCSNPTKNFSLIYNLETKLWTMSTSVITEVIDYNGLINTSEGEIFSRYFVRIGGSIDILSGEDTTQQVNVHLLTRPIKMRSPEQYKKIQRLMSRCELYRANSSGELMFGLWGKQDINKDKQSITLAAYRDSSSAKWPNNIRQNIPVGRMKGKYKTITILQSGTLLPNSSIDGYEIVAIPVENNILR